MMRLQEIKIKISTAKRLNKNKYDNFVFKYFLNTML